MVAVHITDDIDTIFWDIFYLSIQQVDGLTHLASYNQRYDQSMNLGI